MSVCAQTSGGFDNPSAAQDNPSVKKFRTHVQHMLARQQVNTRSKTTGLTERVIAESIYDVYSNPAPYMSDSTIYKYSGVNGSNFNFNFMEFNSYYSLDFSPFDYPYDWSVLSVMADTVKHLSKDSATGPLLVDEVTTATFNNNKNLTSYKEFYYYLGVPDGSTVFHQSYDSQGNISKLVGLLDLGGGLDSFVKAVFNYNAQGKIMQDSVFQYTNNQWVLSAVIDFTYDGSGNITTVSLSAAGATSWSVVDKYENTFYPDNKLKTSISYSLTGTTLEPTLKDTFGYANNSAFATLQSEYMWDNGIWVPMYQMLKHLNAQGLPDTVYQNGYNNSANTWMPFLKTHYTYTTYSNPQLGTDYTFDGVSWSLLSHRHYYYEVYNDPTSVQHITTQQNVRVYPNPATSEINVKFEDGVGRKVTLELVNAAGQRVYRATQHMMQESMKVSIQSLTPGLYWLTVRNENGELMFRETVVKK